MTRQWIPYGLLLVISLIAGIVVGGGLSAFRSGEPLPDAPAINVSATR